jgi:xanthine/CO dehydrogenase XdhC/CoxF family maturation factor
MLHNLLALGRGGRKCPVAGWWLFAGGARGFVCGGKVSERARTAAAAGGRGKRVVAIVCREISKSLGAARHQSSASSF